MRRALLELPELTPEELAEIPPARPSRRCTMLEWLAEICAPPIHGTEIPPHVES